MVDVSFKFVSARRSAAGAGLGGSSPGAPVDGIWRLRLEDRRRWHQRARQGQEPLSGLRYPTVEWCYKGCQCPMSTVN